MATVPSQFEQQTPKIPGTENMPHQTSIDRVQTYPIVKDSIGQAHAVLTSNAYSNALYERATALAAAILQRLEPLQSRLPIERVDQYANLGLDQLEKRFPLVKSETKDLYTSARKPADDAAGLAKAYADGFQSRLSPVTNELSARVAQGQEAIHALQNRLASTVSAIPHNRQQVTEAVSSVVHEVESLSIYITNNAKEIPATAQAKAQPLIDGLAQAAQDIKIELTKNDVPIATRATNVLHYSQDKLTPILVSIKDLLIQKKGEAEAKSDKATAEVKAKSTEVKKSAKSATKEVEKATTNQE